MISPKRQGGSFKMAQKNILQFIILGLINDRPQTGYELTKSFDNDIGEFWSAKHSQIYPQLKTLEEKQYLTHTMEVSGEKLERKRYSITPAGQHLLTAWIAEPTINQTNGKDEFVLKLYFIHDQTDPRLTTMLEEQLQYHAEKLTHLKNQLSKKFPDGGDPTNFGHYLILNHAVSRETEYYDWLNDALKQL